MAWSERVGYRYTQSTGTGTDYLIDNERGTIREDGADFPIISSLMFRNYLMLGRRVDVDASFAVSYAYYPLGTQEDEFRFDLAEEGVDATVSMGYRISDFLYGTLSETAFYRTDYVDTRGMTDRYGGERYRQFNNTLGGQLNWEVAPDDTLTFSLSRGDLWAFDDDFKDQEHTKYAEGLTYTHRLLEGVSVGGEVVCSQYLYKLDSRPDTQQEDYNLFANFNKGVGIPLSDNSSLTFRAGYSRGYSASGITANENDSATATGAVTLETLLRKDLSHQLTYERGLRDGYRSAFETYDRLAYTLRWQGKFASASFRSSWDEVQPSSDTNSNYATWANGINVKRDLTKWLTVSLDSTYTIRTNARTASAATAADEDLYNYDTWTTRLSTGFHITKRTEFTTYVEHTERLSVADTLAYSRDTFEAFLTYTRQF
jgi:hypothetical protein